MLCSKCHTDKPEEEFSRDKRSKTGRYLYCKTCVSAYITEYTQREKSSPNPDELRECNKCHIPKSLDEFYKDMNEHIERNLSPVLLSYIEGLCELTPERNQLLREYLIEFTNTYIHTSITELKPAYGIRTNQDVLFNRWGDERAERLTDELLLDIENKFTEVKEDA